jgi:hypothetical protein
MCVYVFFGGTLCIIHKHNRMGHAFPVYINYNFNICTYIESTCIIIFATLNGRLNGKVPKASLKTTESDDEFLCSPKRNREVRFNSS